MSEPRIVTADVETSPNLADVWGLFDQNISLAQLRESTQVISWAAKIHGNSRVEFRSDFHDGHQAMIERLWEVIDEADVLVTYNGVTFDMKHIKREFLEARLPPPSPVLHVDLLKVVRSNFRFPSNKLDYVSKRLGLPGKVKHEGHALWTACMAGDEKAWSRMRKYNKFDVVLTEQLYDILRPWVQGHPHVGLFTGVSDSCPNCGSTDRQRRGYAYTPAAAFQQYRCSNCGKWHRDTKSIPELRQTTRAVA